jgi:hypothetical protein
MHADEVAGNTGSPCPRITPLGSYVRSLSALVAQPARYHLRHRRPTQGVGKSPRSQLRADSQACLIMRPPRHQPSGKGGAKQCAKVLAHATWHPMTWEYSSNIPLLAPPHYIGIARRSQSPAPHRRVVQNKYRPRSDKPARLTFR